MSCETIAQMMSMRLDDALGCGLTAEMDAHLALCSSCRRSWELFQLLASQLDGAAVVEPPPIFTDMVMGRLQAVPALERGAGAWWAIPAAAAALLSVLTFAVVVLASISLWPALSHPVVGARALAIARLLTSLVVAVGRALWSGFSVLYGGDATMAAAATSIVALLVVLLWARLVYGWWELGGGERPA